MNDYCARLVTLTQFLLLFAACAGCSSREQTVDVRGTILWKEKPLSLEKYRLSQGILRIDFILEKEDRSEGPMYPVIYDEKDGGFFVRSKDGNGVPPGDYRIAVAYLPSYAVPENDLLGGRFTYGRTPIRTTVSPDDNPPLHIELSSYNRENNK